MLTETMTDTFRPFPKLPPELQQMVWRHYRQDRGALRHYFRLSRHGRYHTAYNTATGAFERVTARAATDAHRDPMDPTEAKIRFTGRVRSVLDNGHPAPAVATRRRAAAVSVALGWGRGRGGVYPRSVTTTHAWVNFSDHVFVFESAGYARSGKLRFLARGIHRRRPAPPPPGSWPARIRTLALYLCGAGLAASDHDVFRMMDGLQTLLLVCASGRVCMPPGLLEREQAAGYVDVEKIVENHQRQLDPHAAQAPSCCRCFRGWQQEVQDMEQLMQSLGRGGVKVKVVFDCRQQPLPYV